MAAPDSKLDQSKIGGGAQPATYPLERYTVAPQAKAGANENKSPYYKSAAPSIGLPKGGGALKGIDEKFSVNAQNGTAALQVGFPLTPGRGGFTPNLSVSYNSGSGNSEFGLGWRLSLPSIQRKTDKKLPEYDDASESDVFLLSEAEDLQPSLIYDSGTGTWTPDTLSGITTSTGTYNIKRYRPRIEGLFARIEHISLMGSSENWWKVTTKDNVVTFYGLNGVGRISDPENSARIFKWLPQISFDNKGNVQWYYYQTDNNSITIPAAVHERNRINGNAAFTNVYLKGVKYCNRTPYTPSSSYIYDLNSNFPNPSDFLMEVVLDYGDHDLSVPTPTPSLPVPFRADPFSDFHAGFEIRTYRRCMRVLTFHYFDELNSGNPVLVRSLDLGYQLGTSPSSFAEADYITQVTQAGYTLLSGGTYVREVLPTVTLNYAPLQWSSQVNEISPDDIENAPQGLTGPYEWIDLWGEGLPGILTEQQGGWFYKRNRGNAHFDPALQIAPKPSFQGLGNNLQWQDLNADGRRQLVSKSSLSAGYFELDDDQQWQSFRPFKDWVEVDWNSPYTKVLDLDGDGRPDILLTEELAWRWYENEGTCGYTNGGYGPVFHDEEKGPRLLHNDMMQVIFLADMNGDGMTDIVRVQNGEVCYWPSMGYGKFGARVTMSNSPVFDTPDIFNTLYITLADISGTGAADIMYLGHNKCTAWINLAGNAFGNATDIVPLPGMGPESKVAVMDLLGAGTPCVIWSSPLPLFARAPMRYVDLMGGNKPYLLTSYTNGMGKNVSLTYRQSTQYYLDDLLQGLPWATNLPFPVHCVSQVETSDDVSQTTYSQQYTYHHGYYDHEEREFRGFGRVETTDTDAAVAFNSDGTTENDLDQYPVLTKTWNHTGAWMREGTLLDAFATEYFPTTWAEPPTAPSLPAGLTPQDQREAYRALKGQPLRQEVYALDGSGLQGVPYTVMAHAYSVLQVQPVAENRYGSFLSYAQQSLSWSCERNAADPRVVHDLTLAVDQYGNVLQSAKVTYPRIAGEIPSGTPSYVASMQQSMLATYNVTAYTNDILTGGYHLRVPCDTQSYELTNLTLTDPLWTCDSLLTAIGGATEIEYAATPGGGATMRMLTHDRTLYLGDDAVTILGLGVIQAIVLPYDHYSLSFTDGILANTAYYNGAVTSAMLIEGGYLQETSISQFGSGLVSTNYWLPGGTATYDAAHFFTPTIFYDPWGNATTVTYWSSSATNYYLLPQTITDAVSNVSTVNEYNWCNLQPTQITDANDNQSQILYDALGLAVAVAIMSKDGSTEGDTLAGIDPGNSADLTAQAAFFTDPETNAPILLQGATWRCVYDLTVSPVAVGMIGRVQHDLPTPTDATLLVRLTYTDGLGRLAMHKVQAQDNTFTQRWIGSGKSIYNNKGSMVMRYEPYFTDTPTFDSADYAATVGVSPRITYDPLGRVLRTDLPDGSYTKTEWDAWMQTLYDNNDTLATTGNAWYTAASGSSDTNLNNTATKALYHANTPTVLHLDTLARPICTIQNDGYPDPTGTWNYYQYTSYVELDITGNRMAIADARGNIPFNYSYNMLKADVQLTTMDNSGNPGLMLTDAAGQPLYAWDAAVNQFHFTYDALRRKLTKTVTPSGSATGVLEQLVYGEGTSGDTTNNLRGQRYQGYDGNGLKTITAYDFKGNPLATNEQLLADHTITDVDWSSSPALSSEVFSTSLTYDALSRPVTITDPGGNITTNQYDIGGKLFVVSLNGSFYEGLLYNARGQRDSIYYGNGTETVYTYDSNTFRLTRLLTQDGTATNTYQDLNYWYDPVGNVTYMQDASQRALYFNNSVTLPAADYTYDALYRLIIASGREQIGTALFGSTDNYNDSAWTGVTQPGDDTNTQNYTQQYAYDETGNILTLQHIAGSSTSYTRRYNYASGTNRLANTVVGSTTYTNTHDVFGNITSMPNLSSMGWNTQNQLSVVNLGGGGMGYYQYSGGQRAHKVIDNGSLMDEHIYLGNYEVYRRYISGVLSIERTTVHVADDAGRIAMLEVRTIGTDPGPASLVRYIYSNLLSTATLELDGSGNIISYEEYHPYGTTSYQAMNASINAIAKRYRYTGKERDDETGLYYIGARYYAPWLTRWIAVDPIIFDWYNLLHGQPERSLERQFVELTASTYEYCYANPIRFTDPAGEQPNPTPAPVPTSAPAPPAVDHTANTGSIMQANMQMAADSSGGGSGSSKPGSKDNPIELKGTTVTAKRIEKSTSATMTTGVNPTPTVATTTKSVEASIHMMDIIKNILKKGDNFVDSKKGHATQSVGIIVYGEGGGQIGTTLAPGGKILGIFNFSAFNEKMGLIAQAFYKPLFEPNLPGENTAKLIEDFKDIQQAKMFDNKKSERPLIDSCTICHEKAERGKILSRTHNLVLAKDQVLHSSPEPAK